MLMKKIYLTKNDLIVMENILLLLKYLKYHYDDKNQIISFKNIIKDIKDEFKTQ